MATELQKRAMEIKIDKIKKKEPVLMGKVMIEAGYSKKAAEYPKRMTESKGWQELLTKYFPDDKLLKIHNELLSSKDQRVKMEALKEGYKLKDRYPAGKLKIQAYNEELERLKDSGG